MLRVRHVHFMICNFTFNIEHKIAVSLSSNYLMYGLKKKPCICKEMHNNSQISYDNQ